MLHRLRPFLTTKVVVAAAVLGLLAAGAVAAGSSSRTPIPAQGTATVERSTVTSGVVSSGTVTAQAEQNLGFASGGQLTAVNIKVGDHVAAGDVLATIDDVPARAELAQAQADYRAAQAGLDRAEDSTTVHGAEDSLDQAEDVLRAVRRQAEALDQSDSTAIDSALRQRDIDRATADQARSNRDIACAGGSGTPTCTNAQSAHLTAEQRASTSQGALDSAQGKRSIDRANSRVSIENAQQGVVTAENSVDLSDTDRPHTIDQQEATVAAARAGVTRAQHALNNTVLRAPVDGTVTVLNGAVGEYVGASSGTSALAPGSDAAIPGASGSTNGGSSSSNPSIASVAGPPRPGGSQFLVLSDIDQLRVVAAFSEADAASIKPDQRVDITLDAVPDLQLEGRVLSLAPAGTAISGVVSYYATIGLETDDDRLKGGQTANVAVVTGEESDVLTVPNAAVHKVDGKSAVTVVEGGASRTAFIETGKVGIDRTEVKSGLREGQVVALPGARAPASGGGAR